MKKNTFFFCALMLCLSASSAPVLKDFHKMSKDDLAKQQVLKADIDKKAPAVRLAMKAPTAKMETYDVTIVDCEGTNWDTDIQYVMNDADGMYRFAFDIFLPTGQEDVTLGQTYTLTDMDTEYTWGGNPTTEEQFPDFTAVTFVKTMNDGLVNITVNVTDEEGNIYNIVYQEEPFTEVVTQNYYIKNNWNAIGDWTWGQMTPSTDSTTWTYTGIFGGLGVNINMVADDTDALWFPVADMILTDATMTPQEFDTVLFTYTPATSSLSATVVGRPESLPYYVIGDYNDWSLETAVAMNTTDGVNYTTQISSLWGTFKILPARDWNHGEYVGTTTDCTCAVGQTIALNLVTNGFGSDNDIHVPNNYSNAVLSFAITNNTPQLTFVSGTIQNTSNYSPYYIVGDFNNWDEDAAVEMVQTSDSTYSVQLDTLYGNFKIMSGQTEYKTYDYYDEYSLNIGNTMFLYATYSTDHSLYNIHVADNYSNAVLTLSTANNIYRLTFVSADWTPSIGYEFSSNNLWYRVTGNEPNTVEVSGLYDNEISSIIIPDSVLFNGAYYVVTAIGNSAFNEYGSLISVTIPESVTSIGQNAFSRCSNLISVTWNAVRSEFLCESNYYFTYQYSPFYQCNNISSFTFGNQVQKIPAYLCYHMTGLNSLTIPNSVTSIGAYAFAGCDYFNSLIINENVDTIGPGAFSECYNLSLVIWNARNCKNVGLYERSGYDEEGNRYRYYTYEETSYSPFPSSVQTFIFGDHVQNVPSGLCNGLNQLTSIALPNTVRTIGYSAFSGCSDLISFTMENGVQTIGNSAFSGCSNLPQIVMPNTVTKIDNYAFEGCRNLTTAILGNAVDTIGDEAFYKCERLISIELPATVTELGRYAFYGCSAMNKAIIHSTTQFSSDCNLIMNSQLDTIVAPASIFDVSESAWPSCTKKIKYVRVNSGELTEEGFAVIRRSASTLETLDVSATSNTTIADEAFSNMYRLIALGLPQGLDRISYKAVAECVRLQSIDIPAGITEIGDRAFEDCRSLTTITFGGQSGATADVALQTIGNWAFYNNHALLQLTIPAGVTTIGAGAFYGCTYLEDVAMPASLRNVGDNAFALCNHLTKMQVEADLPPMVAARTFFDVSRNIPVYVPDEAVNDYRNTAIWQEFFIRPISQAATGIETVRESDSDSQNEMLPDGKFFQNGKLLIRRNGKTYDAQGRLIR